jgi:hypothetical protein
MSDNPRRLARMEEGRQARRAGVAREANPYLGKHTPGQACAWNDGWLDEDSK